MHTPEQIEKWAAEADIDTRGDGVRDNGMPSIYYEAWPEQLTLFAALVAQHERERAARLCDRLGGVTVVGQHVAYGMLQACVPDEVAMKWWRSAASNCAAAIRNSDGG